MAMTEAQRTALQKKIAELAEASNGEINEATPNADELLIAATDGVAKALDAVRRLLHKIG